jgi:hypothetical protein
MVLQNNRLAVSQVLCDPSPFLSIEHNAAKLRIHSVALIESQRVLGHHIQFPAEGRESLAIDGVCMAK